MAYEKILIAYDASETSKRALGEALKLAKMKGARLHVVHALDIVTPMGVGMAYVPADMIETYRAQAIKLLDEARAIATAAGVSCETEVADVQGVNDSVAECLQRCALIYGAQLAVLGTHARRGFRRALLGSVAEQFVRLAPCSVLLVRGKGE